MEEPSTKLYTSKANTAFILGIFILIWGVFLLNLATSAVGIDLNNYGIRPRTFAGLVGIITSPVLHSNFQHILANSSAFLTFLALLIVTQPRTWLYVPVLWVSSGTALWLFGPSWTNNIGASGLIYATATFLITIGFAKKDFLNASLGIFCAFLYGASLFTGIFGTRAGISWQGHLLGGLAGIIVAIVVARMQRSEEAGPVRETPISAKNS